MASHEGQGPRLGQGHARACRWMSHMASETDGSCCGTLDVLQTFALRHALAEVLGEPVKERDALLFKRALQPELNPCAP